MVVFGLDGCDVGLIKPTQNSPMLVIEIELRDAPEPTANLTSFPSCLFVQQKLVREGLKGPALRNFVQYAARPKRIQKLFRNGYRFSSIGSLGTSDDPFFL